MNLASVLRAYYNLVASDNLTGGDQNAAIWAQKLWENESGNPTASYSGESVSFWLGNYHRALTGIHGRVPPRNVEYWAEAIFNHIALSSSRPPSGTKNPIMLFGRLLQAGLVPTGCAYTLGFDNGFCEDNPTPAPVTFLSYLLSIIDGDNGALWMLDEAAGAVAVEEFGDTDIDGASSNLTVNQAGAFAGDLAYLFNGTTSRIDVPNKAKLANLSTQRWVFLINATSLGEFNQGFFFDWATGSSEFRLTTSNRIRATIEGVTTSALSQSNGEQIADLLGSWSLVFMDYDDVGTKKIRLWKGIGATLTAITLSNNTATVGGTVNQTGVLVLGNSSAGSGTTDGLISMAAVDNQLWTTEEMEQIIALAEV